MNIIEGVSTLPELKTLADTRFGDMVKAVVDVEQGLLAIDAELHSDLEALLLDGGSILKNLWGINLYPDMQDAGFIVFDSMINLRPSQNNRSRNVESSELRKKIISIVKYKIKR